MSPSLRGQLTAVVACTLLLAGGFTWRAVEHLADNRKPLITLRLLGEPGRRVTATIRLMRDWDGTNESWLQEVTVPWTASYRAAGVDVRWVSFGPARLGDVRAEVESTRDDFDQDQLATFIDASRTGSWDVLLESEPATNPRLTGYVFRQWTRPPPLPDHRWWLGVGVVLLLGAGIARLLIFLDRRRRTLDPDQAAA